MPYTNGFTTLKRLATHFSEHKTEVDADNMEHYEELADAFLGGPLRPDTRECFRPADNALVRYDLVTEEFGILSDDNCILTYYKPNPRWHRFPSNYAYFKYECERRI